MNDLNQNITNWWFWESFWPTVLGVILGIPVALGLNRLVQRGAERAKSKERAARLQEVARLLRESLEWNAKKLRRVAESNDDFVELISEIELDSWSALRNDAFELIPSMELRHDLANHFEQVTRIVSMDEQRTQRFLARLGQGLFAKEQVDSMEAAVLRLLKEQAAEESAEAGELASRLEKFEK